MSKSIPVILGLGVAACVLLSLMMKHLVQHQVERTRSPYAPAVETKLGSRLLQPVQIDEERDGDSLRLVVRARVMAGLNKKKLANIIGLEVWLGAQRAGDPPQSVGVILTDDDDGEPLEVEVKAPRGTRPVPRRKQPAVGTNPPRPLPGK